MNAPVPTKRIVLTRYWVGDFVYHVVDGERGLILHVQLTTEKLLPMYYVVFGDREGEWTHEMELSSEKTFQPEASR